MMMGAANKNKDHQKASIFASSSAHPIVVPPPKFIILDEVDAMTPSAQAALRCIIEKNAANCRFCLLCNELSRIIMPLQSRCAQFRYAPVESREILHTVLSIAVQEGFSVSQPAFDAIVRIARGDMRRAINTLQSAAATAAGSALAANKEAEPSTITDEMIYECTGLPSVQVCESLLGNLLSTPTIEQALARFTSVQTTHGLALGDIVVELGNYALYLPLSDTTRCQLLIDLGDIQYRLCGSGASEAIQRAALVAVFFKARASDDISRRHQQRYDDSGAK